MPKDKCPRCKIRSKNANGYCRECSNAIQRERAERRKKQFKSGELRFPKKKTCCKCQRRLSGSSFSPVYNMRDGLSTCCKGCASAINTLKNLERKYGSDLVSLRKMLIAQKEKCAICKRSIALGTLKNSSHVDHDHVNGRIRGLLCPTCNTGLGRFGDSPERIGLAIKYLSSWERSTAKQRVELIMASNA